MQRNIQSEFDLLKNSEFRFLQIFAVPSDLLRGLSVRKLPMDPKSQNCGAGSLSIEKIRGCREFRVDCRIEYELGGAIAGQTGNACESTDQIAEFIRGKWQLELLDCVKCGGGIRLNAISGTAARVLLQYPVEI